MVEQSSKRRPIRTLIVFTVLMLAALGTLLGGVKAGKTSFVPGLALDLQGGTQLILGVEEGQSVTQENLTQAIAIIRQRVDASGVAEAEISSHGDRNIVVGLPGNPSHATLDLVRKPAQLRFRPVIMSIATPGVVDTRQQAPAAEGKAPAPLPAATPEQLLAEAKKSADANKDGKLSSEPATKPADSSDPAWATEQLVYDLLTLDCANPANRKGGIDDDAASALVTCDTDGTGKHLLGPVDIEGTEVKSAASGRKVNQAGIQTNEWAINLSFTDKGAKQFAESTKRLVNLQEPRNRFAIVLDGLVLSTPGLNLAQVGPQGITDGNAEITGSFDAESANALANQLNFGSLPINFQVQSEDQISATLGTEQLEKGLIAGILGLALVLLYLIVTYRGLSVVAVSSLVLAGVLTYAVIGLLSWFMGFRLSLPGFTGLIISVGITADSFIVYFERIRDELRDGRSLEKAVATGWARAKRTILASDAVNILAASVLYLVTVGGVRGFAFTLGLTTVVDVIVVFLFTHPLMLLLSRLRFFSEGHRFSGVSAQSVGRAPAYRGRGNAGLTIAERKAREAAKQARSQSEEGASKSDQIEGSEA